MPEIVETMLGLNSSYLCDISQYTKCEVLIDLGTRWGLSSLSFFVDCNQNSFSEQFHAQNKDWKTS